MIQHIEGAEVEEVLGYGEDDEKEEFAGENDGDLDFKAFQKQVRVDDETRRAEANRQAGEIKTRHIMVKAWEVSGFTVIYLTVIYLLHTNNCITGICRTHCAVRLQVLFYFDSYSNQITLVS